MMPTVPLALLAGLLSFLSPCVLPLVPSYLAYVGGSAAEVPARRRWALQSGLLFVVGFSLIFIALGASASAVGVLLRSYRSLLMPLGGLLVMVFGLMMLGLLRLPLLYRDTRKLVVGESVSPWGALLLGMAFAAGWTPCIGPVLGAILTLASASGTLSQGVLLLASYALGLAIPFLLAALMLERFLSFSAGFRRFLPWVERASGALLLVVGLLMVSGYYAVLNTALIRLTPEWLFSRL